MKVTLLFRILFGVLVISLTACGGGGGGSSDGGDGGGGVGDDKTDVSNGGESDGGPTTQPASTTITLSGADTSSLGSTAEVSFYAFRENLAGSNLFLSATSSGTAMNFVRFGVGELPELDPAEFASGQSDAVVFNITDVGVSIRININNVAYLYSSACISGCSGVNFDSASRTLVLDNVALTPTIGGDSNSQATSELTLDGTIVWTEADENPDAPAFNSKSSGVVDYTSDVSLEDLTGVWDSSVGNDEIYTVIKSNGTYVSYDYMGDSVDMGANCYDVENDTITDLGNGHFRIGENRFGSFYFSGELLAFEAPEGTYFMEKTALLESDFSALCH